MLDKRQPQPKLLNLNNISAVLFDLDGTMVDNMKYHILAWQEFLKRYKIKLSDDDFKELLLGKRNDQILAIIFGRQLTPEEIKYYAEEKEELYRELYVSHIAEVDGLRSLLRRLKERNIKLAVATSAPETSRNLVLESLKIADKFDVIQGEEHAVEGKPSPEIFLVTAEKLGVPPQACLVFEDTPAGIEAARRAGMKVVGLLTTHSEKELVNADLVVENYEQLQLA